MNAQNREAVGRAVTAVVATAVFLFLHQALRALFSMLFGLIYDALFAGTASLAGVGLWLLAVLLALLSPLAAPRRAGRLPLGAFVAAGIAFLARIPLTPDIPSLRLASAIAIVAAAGIYLAALLRSNPRRVALAMMLALAADQVLRAVGHTWDVTMRPGWWPWQVVLSAALVAAAAWAWRWGGEGRTERAPGSGAGLLAGLSWGAWLFLETSLLNFPNAIARWTGAPYFWAALLLLPATINAGLLGGPSSGTGSRAGAMLASGLFLAGLAAGLLLPGVAGLLALLLAQGAAVALLGRTFQAGPRPGRDRLGVGLALGGLLFLLLSFAFAFAFTYPYTLASFRGMGVVVLLVAGLLAALPALRLVGRRGEGGGPVQEARAAAEPPARQMWALGAAVAVLMLVVAAAAWPRGPRPPAPGETLRAATYNIHYGYDSAWHLSLEGQARAIEESGADWVALQEVDTGRATSYMIDDAEWLARRLGMEAVYLPCVERLTGIALLSRYRVTAADRLLLPSELEQTGIVWAELDVGGSALNGFGIWMGLEPEERARQLDAALPFLAAHPGPGTFGGDFNSTPDSPVYERIAAAGWVDPFAALGLGSPPTDPAIEPHKRIDFVWLRDLTPVAAEVSPSLASDHRLVVVEVARP